MLDVRCFTSGYGLSKMYGERAKTLLMYLIESGIYISDEPQKCDVSVAIYGLFENPTCLFGKKVIAYDRRLWHPNLGKDWGWNLFKPILEEYYDEFLDITDLTLSQIAERIKQYANDSDGSETDVLGKNANDSPAEQEVVRDKSSGL